MLSLEFLTKDGFRLDNLLTPYMIFFFLGFIMSKNPSSVQTELLVRRRNLKTYHAHAEQFDFLT